MTFQPNPVALRESRAMWRGARSFLLLLCYAGALSLVACLAYSSEVRNAEYYAKYNGGEIAVQSARVGHTLFVALSFVQVVAWLLIAPALSATSISSERERGLLESLLMSQLKPRQIIGGKLGVSASFLGILIVATLPILAMCFLLGGVSPGEFGGALLIQIATAFCALSLGVWLSTALRLSTHALGTTFGVLFGWIVLSMMAFYTPNHGPSMTWWDQFVRLLGLSNPLIGLNTLIDGERWVFSSFFLSSEQSWPLCIGFQVLAGVIFLALASRSLARPAGEDEERQARRLAQATPNAQGIPSVQAASTVGAGPVAGFASTWSAAPEEVGHFDVPLLSLLLAGGPLLRHHLRASWRWKKPRGWALKWWLIGGGLFVLGNLWGMSWSARYPNDAVGLLAVLVAMAAFASSIFVIGSSGLSIARDRELGTWNGLRLSSLRSPEIARAKMLAPLLSAVGYCVLLLSPLLAWTLLVIAGRQSPSYSWRDLWALPLCFPFWILGTLQLGGWALLCSMRARRSSIALVAAFAGALIWVIGLPVVFEMSVSGYSYSYTQELRHILALGHPIYAFLLAAELSWRYRIAHWDVYGVALATHAIIALCFYFAVTKSIALREK